MTTGLPSQSSYPLPKNMKRAAVFTLLLLVSIGQLNAAIRYVNMNANGTGNGASWTNAYTDFKTAIDNAASGDEVWVAKGTYQAATGTSFSMKDGVKIYGGFSGGEATLNARNWRSNPTILRGNNFRVLNNSNLSSTALLDGFTITGGNINSSGGGVYNDSSSPTFANCIFSGNTGVYGGAVSNYASSPTFSNCIFSGNSANYGGAVDNDNSSPTFYNCLFNGNTAIDDGAAIYNYSGVTALVNVTLANNGTLGLYNANGIDKITIKNSIIWDGINGGYTASNSLLKGLNPSGTDNIDAVNLTANDIFTDYVNSNYTLKQTSPALNTGENAAFTGLSAATLDLAGNVRVYNYNNSGMIDMGAYEYQGNPPVMPVTLVDYTAKIEGNNAKLQWQTSSETNNKSFIVYRRADDGDFITLGEVKTATSSNLSNKNYQYIDRQPLHGNNYYKLAQVDLDGKATDLGLRSLNFSLSAVNLQLYPNPTTTKIFMTGAAKGAFTLFNSLGQKIALGSLAQLNAGWDVSSLKAGMYYFSIDGKSYKVIKQ